MAKGGIYDQLGGGFHRYSVDDRWLVPHFEKMLYDNALLARLYLDAGRALGEPEFLTVAREILDYVLREMTSPEGGFYSTQDADSEGEEGKFFVWTPEEARAVLGERAERDRRALLRHHRGGQLRGQQHPASHHQRRRRGAAVQEKPGGDGAGDRRDSPPPVRGARAAGQAGARRKDPRRVERDDDRRAGRGLSGARRRALLEGRRARRGVRDDAAVGRPRAQALVQGWRRALQRLPGGLRAVRGQPDRSLRSLAREPLPRVGAHDGRRDPRALPRSRKGRLLLHLGRPRAADHALEGGLRRLDALGQQRGGDGAAEASRLHRRGALLRRGAAHAQPAPQLRRAAAVRVLAHARGDRPLSARCGRDRDRGRSRHGRPGEGDGSTGWACSTCPTARSSSPTRARRRAASCRRRCGANRRSTAS